MARVLAWLLLVSACGGDESEPHEDTGPNCPTGQVPLSGGGCMPVGIQGQPQPDWRDPSNVFSGGEQPVVSDGNLPVPEAPPLPDA